MSTLPKKRKSHLHIDLEEEYAPLCKKNTGLMKQRSLLTKLRNDGKKHVDLWTDGYLYPVNPFSRTVPNFSNVTSLMRFVGDGESGLLGYCKGLISSFDVLKSESLLIMNERNNLQAYNNAMQEKIRSQEGTIQELQKRLIISCQKQTILGLRKRKRTLNNVENLKIGGGALKRRIKAVRTFFHPSKQFMNEETISHPYSMMMSRKLTSQILEKRKYEFVKRKCAQKIITDGMVTANDIQSTCDLVGISRKAYTALFKTMKISYKRQNIHAVPLPRPYHVKSSRCLLNKDIMEILGEPYHIAELFNSSNQHLQYSALNNIFFSLRAIEEYIVRFYNITVEETNAKLIFVIKLDESEIIKGQKIERVSITLMNRALDKTMEQRDHRRFSVQSENHIWWLGAFQVIPCAICYVGFMNVQLNN